MSGGPTVRLVKWKPTRYAVMIGFVAANRAECKTAEERRFACEAITRLHDAYHFVKPSFEELGKKARFTDRTFRDECARFETTKPELEDVTLTPAAWAWLKAKMDALPDSGEYSQLRIGCDASVAQAAEGDFEVKT